MVEDLNLYCSKIKNLRQKQWHPETLYHYLLATQYEFLSPEYWDFYTLDKTDLRYKIKEEFLEFEI